VRTPLNQSQIKTAVAVFLVFLISVSYAEKSGPVSMGELDVAQQCELAGDWLQAATIYKTIVAHFPENEGYFYHCVDLCSKAGRFDWALDLIEWRRSLKAQDLNLEVLKAQYLHRAGREKDASDLWKTIVEMYPKDEWIVVMVANSMIEEKLFIEAEQTYVRARKRLGQKDQFTLNLALVYEMHGEYAKAAREWISFVKSKPNQIGAAESHLMRFPASEKVIRSTDRILKEGFETQNENIALARLLCRYRLRFGLFQEALESSVRVDAMSPESARGEALFEFAQQAFLGGETKYSETAYKKILRDFSTFRRKDQVLYCLAQTHIGMGLFMEAVSDFKFLVLNYPESRFAAQALLEKGRLERDSLKDPYQAIATFNELIWRFPATRQRDEGFLEQGDCYLLMNDLPKAKDIFEQSSRGAFVQDRIVFLKSSVRLAEIEFFNGDFNQSVSRSDSLFRYWIETDEFQDDLVNDALTLNVLIKTFLEVDREGLLKLSSGLLLFKQKRTDQAIDVLDRLIAGRGKSDPIVAEALFQKGSMLISEKRYPESLISFEMLLNSFPKSFHSEGAMERVGWLQEKTGRFKEAAKTYERFIELFPRSSFSGEVRNRIREMEAKPL
jgi:tetratricopeptide (TPR) repeat protein